MMFEGSWPQSKLVRCMDDGTPSQDNVHNRDCRRGSAEIFFSTIEEPNYGERTWVTFDTVTDGEWQEYEIDFGANPQWQGTITSLRLDPGIQPDQMIEIDRIWFPESE